MPTFNTSIKVMSIDIPLEVDYKIVNEGSSPTYSPMYGADGGDAPEIEILSIEKKSNSEDITEWCNKHKCYNGEPRFGIVLKQDTAWRDPIRTVLFNMPYLPKNETNIYKETVEDWTPTYFEYIEELVIASDSFSEACHDYGGDYD